jgi:hypothetical protein
MLNLIIFSRYSSRMVFQYDSIVAVISTTMFSFLTAMDILFSFRKKKLKKWGRERERE